MVETARRGSAQIGMVSGYFRARTGSAVPDASIRIGKYSRAANSLRLEAVAGRPAGQ